jgi:hypothetical protein
MPKGDGESFIPRTAQKMNYLAAQVKF